MTAEIAIGNRQALALAADSAVTIGRKRVWKHTNKLFSLGPDNDIAVMVHNAAELAGYPWEFIIKRFRAENAGTKFNTVEDCAKVLMGFLEDHRFCPDERNRVAYLAFFLEPLEHIKASLPSKLSKSAAAFVGAVEKECDDLVEKAQRLPELPAAPSLQAFKKKYSIQIKNIGAGVFGRSVRSSLAEKLAQTMYELWRRQARSPYYTGVVVAGYGHAQFFSEVVEIYVDGKDDSYVRQWVNQHLNTNRDDARKTFIMPFGQSDIFHLFMEGIDPQYQKFLHDVLERVLNDKSTGLVNSYVPEQDRTVENGLQRRDNCKIAAEFMREFAEYRNEEVVQPILEAVRALPKEEMADMAHALVEITSLRRKVDSPIDSVGGPVDIAVISKGDGLVWVERKHYFDLEKNKDFLYRKFGGKGSGHDEP